jgi:membrane protein implicated in regulation of membrane protease activity
VNPSPLRRAALVLAGYVLVAWFVLGMARWLQRALALPPLFGTLLTGVLFIGLPVALAVAWRYPQIGESRDSDDGPPSLKGRSGR